MSPGRRRLRRANFFRTLAFTRTRSSRLVARFGPTHRGRCDGRACTVTRSMASAARHGRCTPGSLGKSSTSAAAAESGAAMFHLLVPLLLLTTDQPRAGLSPPLAKDGDVELIGLREHRIRRGYAVE